MLCRRRVPSSLLLKTVSYLSAHTRTGLILRRSAINPKHCDTAFPSEPLGTHGEKGYFTLRFELSQISAEYVILPRTCMTCQNSSKDRILNMAMKVKRPPYSKVLELDAKLYVTLGLGESRLTSSARISNAIYRLHFDLGPHIRQCRLSIQRQKTY